MVGETPQGGFPQGEGPRYQPEFAPGERIARLEALYEAFKKTEIEWQEQIDRRFEDVAKDMRIQREERIAELTALRRESAAALEAQDKAINKAGEAQEKQNTLTREDALRARESVDERVRALERGESVGQGSRHTASQTITVGIALIAAFAGLVIAVASILHG